MAVSEVTTRQEESSWLLSALLGSPAEDWDLPRTGNSKGIGMTTNLLIPSSQESVMIRGMADAFTQWGQLSPSQRDVPEEHRSLVLLGLPISKPDVISQLERKGELEREVPKAPSPGRH
ncbi:zinc finger protein 570-like [Echinops telfairi]|uniref:Zinc finger protein 570-like n=1 Tax=Echinops telfairi TaxID=9371 RepID=A0AC55CQ99_ECHTE|nr:zinc finger protein 570-like [Echinops telfairi]